MINTGLQALINLEKEWRANLRNPAFSDKPEFVRGVIYGIGLAINILGRTRGPMC